MNHVVLFFSSPDDKPHVKYLLGPSGPPKSIDPTLRFSDHCFFLNGIEIVTEWHCFPEAILTAGIPASEQKATAILQMPTTTGSGWLLAHT